jgi:hypothetical protein
MVFLCTHSRKVKLQKRTYTILYVQCYVTIIKQIQRKEQEAKQLALNFAKENERKAKQTASEEQTVKEEKSN